jgi:hypothetical protein
MSISGDDVTILGLCINSFNGEAVEYHGWPPEETCDNAVIVGCYLNTDPTGSVRRGSCGLGLDIGQDVINFRIGGDLPDERNIISGASREVRISHCGSFQIINNLIGTDRTGTIDLNPDRVRGVYIGHCLETMRPSVVRDNVIAGGYGTAVKVFIVHSDSSFITFSNNHIGVGLDGTPMGGGWYTVEIGQGRGHVFTDNVIAYAQAWSGMELWGGATDYVTISRNSIYANNRLGINLCNLPHETLYLVDLIDGVYAGEVNEGIDPCLCDSVVNVEGSEGGTTTAYFTCMPDCIVEVFIGDTLGWNPPCPEADYGRVYSGYTYLGNAQEIAPGSIWSQYRFSVSPALAEGTLLTSTATNQNGSTSEFGCTCEVSLTGEPQSGCLPSHFQFLAPNPNPCDNGTALRYHLPEDCHVRINAYDLKGRLVAAIRDEYQRAGVHGIWWKPVDRQGDPLPTGTYVIRMITAEFIASEALAVLR